MPDILVTGFDPFPGVPHNPTAEIAAALNDRPPESGPVHAVVLPTSFERAPVKLGEAIADPELRAILCLGVAVGVRDFRIEQWARNYRRPGRPDNDGPSHRGGALAPNGPGTYATTLPVAELLDALHRVGIPANPSVTAGSYVCNAIFYHAMRMAAARKKPTRAGFIHIPQAAEQGGALPFADLERGVRVVIDVLRALP